MQQTFSSSPGLSNQYLASLAPEPNFHEVYQELLQQFADGRRRTDEPRRVDGPRMLRANEHSLVLDGMMDMPLDVGPTMHVTVNY